MAQATDATADYWDHIAGRGASDAGGGHPDSDDWRASTPAELRRPTAAADLPAISQHQRTLESLETRAVEDALAEGRAPLRYCQVTGITYHIRSLAALEAIQRRERAAFRW